MSDQRERSLRINAREVERERDEARKWQEHVEEMVPYMENHPRTHAKKIGAAARAALAGTEEATPPHYHGRSICTGKHCTGHDGLFELGVFLGFEAVLAGTEEPEHSNGACIKCGRADNDGIGDTYWFADNELWNEVIPERVGLFCPCCFTDLCESKGIGVGWRVGRIGEVEALAGTHTEEENDER